MCGCNDPSASATMLVALGLLLNIGFKFKENAVLKEKIAKNCSCHNFIKFIT